MVMGKEQDMRLIGKTQKECATHHIFAQVKGEPVVYQCQTLNFIVVRFWGKLC